MCIKAAQYLGLIAGIARSSSTFDRFLCNLNWMPASLPTCHHLFFRRDLDLPDGGVPVQHRRVYPPRLAVRRRGRLPGRGGQGEDFLGGLMSVRQYRWMVSTNGTSFVTQLDALPESSNAGTRATASPRTGRATGTRTARTAATRWFATSPVARRSSSVTTQTAFRQEAVSLL